MISSLKSCCLHSSSSPRHLLPEQLLRSVLLQKKAFSGLGQTLNFVNVVRFFSHTHSSCNKIFTLALGTWCCESLNYHCGYVYMAGGWSCFPNDKSATSLILGPASLASASASTRTPASSLVRSCPPSDFTTRLKNPKIRLGRTVLRSCCYWVCL